MPEMSRSRRARSGEPREQVGDLLRMLAARGGTHGRLGANHARHHLVERTIERLARRGDLQRDAFAVLIAGDHPPDTANLSFDARKTRIHRALRFGIVQNRLVDVHHRASHVRWIAEYTPAGIRSRLVAGHRLPP